jgi:hypothetical protein
MSFFFAGVSIFPLRSWPYNFLSCLREFIYERKHVAIYQLSSPNYFELFFMKRVREIG